jgi:protein TonB
MLKKNTAVDVHESRSLFLAIGVIVSLLIVITAFEWRFYDDHGIVNLSAITDDFEEILEIPVTEQPPPPPPKIVQPEIIEIPDDEDIQEEVDVDLDIEVTEYDIIEVIEFDEPDEEAEDPDKIFLIVEKDAEPVGGLSAFYKFVYDNIKYPRQARRTGVEGKVFVQFVVEKDGSITDVVILKGIGMGCDEETIRVILKVPRWKPAKQRGKPVRVRRALSINFRLQ